MQAGKSCLGDWEQSQQLDCALTDARFQWWKDVNTLRIVHLKLTIHLM